MNEPAKEDTKLQHWRRVALMVISALYTFFFIGAFFGWGPMQLLLEKNGSFSFKCTPEEQERGEICPEQTSALVNVQFYAQVSMITSPLLGQIVDSYGAAVLAYLMAITSWIGLILLMVAVDSVDQLLYPAFLFMAMSTWMGAILIMSNGYMFTGHNRSRAIFLISGLFDAGSITYLGLWAIGDGTNASLTEIIGGYFVLSVVLFGGGCYFWTVAKPTEEVDANDDEKEEMPTELLPDTSRTGQSNQVSGEISAEAPTNSAAVLSEENTISTDIKGLLGSKVTGAGDEGGALKVLSESVTPDTNDMVLDPEEKPESDHVAGHATPDCDYIILAERTPRKQLLSRTFLVLVFFSAVHSAANEWTTTTTRDFLAFLGDDELDNKYLRIFTLMMPISLVAVPFTDAMLRYFGFHGAFQAINVLALGYSFIRLFSDNLNVQILGFFIFSFFRSFMYGITQSFLPAVLSPNVVGKATGLLFALGGVTALLNIPLSSFAIEQQNGDFFIPNLIYTALIIPCIIAAWFLGRDIELERAAKHKLSNPVLRQSCGGVLLRDPDD
jgi:MFS family permease